MGGPTRRSPPLLRPDLRVLLRPGDQRVDLGAGPVLPHRRHTAATVAQERLDPLAVAEQRVPAEGRADVGVIELMALLADARPLLVAERRAAGVRVALLDELVV